MVVARLRRIAPAPHHCQFGFVPKRCTTQLLTTLVSTIGTSFSRERLRAAGHDQTLRGKTVLIKLDWAKAFDK
eukprot:5205787-Amphidinium_carterae.1